MPGLMLASEATTESIMHASASQQPMELHKGRGSCSSSNTSRMSVDGLRMGASSVGFPLLALPEELLLEVAASCSDPKDVVSLITCCKRLSFLRLEPVLTAAWIQRNLSPLQACVNPTILTKMLRAVSEEHHIQVLRLLGPPALKQAPLGGGGGSTSCFPLNDLLPTSMTAPSTSDASPAMPSTSSSAAAAAAQLPPRKPALNSLSATPRIARGSTGLASTSRGGPPMLSALSCTLTGRTGSSLSGSHRSALRPEAPLSSSNPGDSSLGTVATISSSEITPAPDGRPGSTGASTSNSSSGSYVVGPGLQRPSMALVDGSSMAAVAGSAVGPGETEEVREEEEEEGEGAPDLPDCYLSTPEVQSEWLCAALHLGRRRAAMLLLAPGTHPILDYRDGLPLRLAAGHGLNSIVAALLERGARVDKQDNSALARAAAHGQVSTIKLLLGAGADVRAGHDRALHLAVSSGSLPAVEALLAAGANVTSTADFALRNAARLGHAAIVRALLAAGADPRAAHDDALFQAAKGGHVDVVKVLLAQGAGSHGIQDIITLAEERRHTEIARLLRASQKEPLLMKFSFPAALARLSTRAGGAAAAASSSSQAALNGQQGQAVVGVQQQQQQQQQEAAVAGGAAGGHQEASGVQAAAVLSPEAAAQMQQQAGAAPSSPTVSGSKLKRFFCWVRGR